MGLDQAETFAGVEAEDADLVIAIGPANNDVHAIAKDLPRSAESDGYPWIGRANRLDPHPLYRWPVIGQVSDATQGSGIGAHSGVPDYPPLRQTSEVRAADVILGRRSAQRFDTKFKMNADVFYHMLDRLLDRPNAPWDVWTFTPRLHPVFFVHRVEGLDPGVYALPRHPAAADALRQQMRQDFEWQTPENAPAHLPFVRLLRTDCRIIAKTMNCHQAIASDSCFALSMVSEFGSIVSDNPWRYRQLHWRRDFWDRPSILRPKPPVSVAPASAATSMTPLHEVLGITTTQFQALYHFTVGRPLTDDRILTLPAYPDRRASPREEAPA